MKKKFLLSVLVIVLLFISAFAGASVAAGGKKPSDYKIGMTYSMAVNNDKPAIVLVYADWCGYCKRFMPNFETLYRQYSLKYNFSMVNSDTNGAITRQLGVNGYPTVFIIDKKYNQKIEIPNEYYSDVNAMSARFNLYLKRRQEWANKR